jgi:hypothetical protein
MHPRHDKDGRVSVHLYGSAIRHGHEIIRAVEL